MSKRIIIAIATVILFNNNFFQLEARADRDTISGIYALINANEPVRDKTLNSPYITGITLRGWWKELEPQENVYDWHYLDGEIERAGQSGKKVKIIILAAAFTPDWVYRAGASYFVFKHKAYPGKDFKTPVPWNKVYLKKYENFVKAVFEHFNDKASVVGITLGGPGRSSAEMHMPKEWPICPSDDPEICCSKARWVNAWKITIDIFNKYARKPYGIAINEPFGDDTLDWINEVVDYAYSTAKQNVFFQWNGLKEKLIYEADKYPYNLIKERYSHKTTTGFQLAGSFTKFGERIGSLSGCFDLARQAKVYFVEISEIDIVNPLFEEDLKYGQHLFRLSGT